MKYAWIEANRDLYSVSRMSSLLGVSRTGYCQWRIRKPCARAQANLALDARVAAIHRASGRSYGRERIHRQIHDEGMPVGRERIRKSLERQGLRPVYRRPYRVTTDSNHDKPLSPNLLERRYDGWSVNQAWVADITYVATDEGWLYLAAVMDLASRRIVGWSMSERIQAELVCEALKSAYWRRKPGPGLIMHTDRGSQYASTRYRGLVRDYRMKASMSSKGNRWDNAAMESFFKTLKVERVYQVRYSTRAQARLDIVDWIEGFYNRQRLHSSTGYRTPVALENSTAAA